MYTVGLQSAADAFLVSSLKTQVVLALIVLFILLVFGFGSQKDGAVDGAAPVFLPGSHLLAIAPFFRQRFEFLNDGFRKTGQSLFQFSMLRVSIVGTQILAGYSNYNFRRLLLSFPESRAENLSSLTNTSISLRALRCFLELSVPLFFRKM